MPVYEYTALNKKGKTISGLIDSENIRIAKTKLRSTAVYPVSITEVDEQVHNNRQRLTFFQSKIGISEISMMTRQLATLISAGFPLTTALNTMLSQTKKESFKRVLSRIKDSIEEGSSFAEALAKYPGIFSRIYLNMVRAGEASGTLGIVLDRLADISEKQHHLNSKIKSAMAYPFLMTLVGAGVLFFLLTVIVPNITSIFVEMNQALPLTTQILISTSSFLRQWWLLILGFLLLLLSAYNIAKKNRSFRFLIDRFILRIPVVGDLVRKIAVARFAGTLGTLLENGVSLLSALDIVQNVTGNKIFESAITDAAKEVERGNELGSALARNNHFPYLAVEMIKIGEQSGSLEPMLKKTAAVYENEIETTIVGMTSLMEPVIILIMAFVVGFIVLSICLPIFEMNQLIK
jgi:general secretion pathway protein F